GPWAANAHGGGRPRLPQATFGGRRGNYHGARAGDTELSLGGGKDRARLRGRAAGPSGANRRRDPQLRLPVGGRGRGAPGRGVSRAERDVGRLAGGDADDHAAGAPASAARAPTALAGRRGRHHRDGRGREPAKGGKRARGAAAGGAGGGESDGTPHFRAG